MLRRIPRLPRATLTPSARAEQGLAGGSAAKSLAQHVQSRAHATAQVKGDDGDVPRPGKLLTVYFLQYAGYFRLLK